jgi:nucleotide-binding universal stress UspA family protein
MRSIVVGVNGTEDSRAAQRWSAQRIEREGGHVVAVHAVRPTDAWELAAVQVDPDPVVAEYCALLEGDWTRELREMGVEHTTRIERGRPADALLRVADEEDADLIVVGNPHAHGLIHALTHQSALHRLLERSDRPVVAVPVDDG